MPSNKEGYNQWSEFYDTYPNATVATDELTFPFYWSDLRNKRVLEVGCGTGRHTLRLVQQGNHVTGVDLSSGMLNIARKKLDPSKVNLIEGDFLITPILGLFDAVLISLVLEHFKDLPLFFSKVSQLLSEGGQIFISEAVSAAHFRTPDGKEVWLESSKHLDEDFEKSLEGTNLKINIQENILGSSKLAKIKTEWQKHIDRPLLKIWVLKKEKGPR